MSLELPRRGFLLGALAVIAAPAIVRFQSIMPVRAIRTMPLPSEGVQVWTSYPWSVTVDYNKVDPARIDFAEIDVNCLYVPPDASPEELASLKRFERITDMPSYEPGMTQPNLHWADRVGWQYDAETPAA
jgi:hypothetical protein